MATFLRRAEPQRPSVFTGVNWDSWQADGLRYWWPLYSAVGLDLVDVIRREACDVAAGAAVDLASDMGRTFTNNGSTSLRADDTVPVVTAAPMTLAAWGNPGDTGARTLISICDGVQPDRYYQLRTNSSAVNFISRASGAATASSAATVVTNRWQHFAGKTASTTSRYAYLNGIPGAQETTSISGVVASRIALGSREVVTPNERFLGGMFDCRIYDRALSDTEVWALYDPATRWDLYWRPSRRVYVRVTPATGNRRRRLLVSA